MSRRYENASSVAHIHVEDVPSLAQGVCRPSIRLKRSNYGILDNSADEKFPSTTKALQLQPSDATVHLVAIPGRRMTPTEILQLPEYDKPEPTLLGIPADIRLQILKLALPHTIKAIITTNTDPRGTHFLKYKIVELGTRWFPWLHTQYVSAPASPLPSFMHCSRQLYDEGSEVMEGFKLCLKHARPTIFKSYPPVLCKNAKTIEFGAWAVWADHAPLFANFHKLRELDFSSPFLESPQFIEWAGITQRSSAVTGLVWLETPIPNPDEGDFTQRVLPRFNSQGQRLLCDRFHDAVYKNNIKITFNCLLGPFEPCQTGDLHKFREFIALAVGSPKYGI